MTGLTAFPFKNYDNINTTDSRTNLFTVSMHKNLMNHGTLSVNIFYLLWRDVFTLYI